MLPQRKQDRPEARRQVARVTWIGLLANLLLSVAKFAGGLAGGSQAVVADAVHSLSDSSTDIAILVGVRYWTQPPDEHHPHGHGRIETLVTLGIGLLLGGVAMALAWNAVASLREAHTATPGWVAFYVALGSLVVKEWLFRWTARVGRRVGSQALVANAWHHRSDAFSSVPVLVAVAAARINPDLAWLDHVGALVVSVFILRAGARVLWPALRELVDSGARPAKIRQIKGLALGIEGVREVHNVRTRYAGGQLQVDLHLLVPGDMTVCRSHAITEEVQARLMEQGPELVDVVVHVEPYEQSAHETAADDLENEPDGPPGADSGPMGTRGA
jgi:cation diffusion facilitator family transporter